MVFHTIQVQCIILHNILYSSCFTITLHTVLVAHNGFPFDFIFLVAEIKRRKLDEIFNSITLYFADTLYDAKRVSSTSCMTNSC